MFATCWTEDILAETVRALRRQNPALEGGVVTALADKIRDVMSERIDQYPSIPLDGLVDDGDLHLHSAAVAGGVDMLLTNDRGFHGLPPATLEQLPYEILDADSFLVLVDDSGPERVKAVLNQQWEHRRRRDPGIDMPQRLRDAGCPRFAQRVWEHQRK